MSQHATSSCRVQFGNEQSVIKIYDSYIELATTCLCTYAFTQAQLMVTSIIQWIKSCSYVILAIIGFALLASLGHGIITLKIENNSLINHNKLLRDEIKQLMEEANQLHADHNVWSAQILYIQKWMEPISELEYHIYAIIQYSKLQKKESEFYSFSEDERYRMVKLRKAIGYDVDVDHVDEIVVKAIGLIVKFKTECQKFLDALLHKDIEEMKTLQAQTNMEKIKEKMEDFAREVVGLHSKRSTTTAVQQDGIVTKIVSGIYHFGAWILNWIGRLFTS